MDEDFKRMRTQVVGGKFTNNNLYDGKKIQSVYNRAHLDSDQRTSNWSCWACRTHPHQASTNTQAHLEKNDTLHL